MTATTSLVKFKEKADREVFFAKFEEIKKFVFAALKLAELVGKSMSASENEKEDVYKTIEMIFGNEVLSMVKNNPNEVYKNTSQFLNDKIFELLTFAINKGAEIKVFNVEEAVMELLLSGEMDDVDDDLMEKIIEGISITQKVGVA
ncbi:hypothetical protein TMA_020 [Thermus phage TMA]|uniref:hypothetical protein n=1 Tax=Thermus phage TMA TaxID=699370 RepID=UPI0000E6898A|nr:hypothetical protein TMA_020 [Thermus phage TMA]YP_874033.1 hypothetical protein YS40_020 [Thermus phage phiYS40]ABJ91414.1 hypothetical protein YS40_020 [Thermus phage phiYS40]BAK53538.1 hypothetical protein YSP_020 [Thermus phage phiYS40]BAK53708.1 hypothetical protein TMA_020 [Thermus phage TMA]